MKLYKNFYWALMSVALLAFSPIVAAQNAISTGSISGQVTDPSDKVIPGVTVTLENVSEGVKFTAKTNNSGFYSFSSLPVGAYDITISQDSFKTTVIRNVQVQVGQNTASNAKLELGNLTESVTVTAEQPLMHTTESTNSTVLTETLIDNLPLSGRRYTDFVLLAPNVTADGDFGLVAMAGQQGGADSGYANGNGSNSFTVDGASATSNYTGEARGAARACRTFSANSPFRNFRWRKIHTMPPMEARARDSSTP